MAGGIPRIGQLETETDMHLVEQHIIKRTDPRFGVIDQVFSIIGKVDPHSFGHGVEDVIVRPMRRVA